MRVGFDASDQLFFLSVEDLAYHLVYPSYYISEYFPLLTQVSTNKLPWGGKRSDPNKISDVT